MILLLHSALRCKREYRKGRATEHPDRRAGRQPEIKRRSCTGVRRLHRNEVSGSEDPERRLQAAGNNLDNLYEITGHVITHVTMQIGRAGYIRYGRSQQIARVP